MSHFIKIESRKLTNPGSDSSQEIKPVSDRVNLPTHHTAKQGR